MLIQTDNSISKAIGPHLDGPQIIATKRKAHLDEVLEIANRRRPNKRPRRGKTTTAATSPRLGHSPLRTTSEFRCNMLARHVGTHTPEDEAGLQTMVDLEMLGYNLRQSIDRVTIRPGDDFDEKLQKLIHRHTSREKLLRVACASRAIGWIDDLRYRAHEGEPLLEFYFGGEDGQAGLTFSVAGSWRRDGRSR